MWKDVAEFIQARQTFLITTHLNPEGDAIGSEIALMEYLQDAGKTVHIINSDPTPRNCQFLDPDSRIQIYDPSGRPDIFGDIDAVIIVDVNTWEHIGELGKAIKSCGKPRVCIDHHQEGSPDIAEIYIRDTDAARAMIRAGANRIGASSSVAIVTGT